MLSLEPQSLMSRRTRKTLPKRHSDRPKRGGAFPSPQGRPQGRRSAAKPFAAAKHRPEPTRTEQAKDEAALLPTKVQTVTVTADENNMRVDRFLEARFPGLSFSHIQRIVRKGEFGVNRQRGDSTD